jgi:hypothetical protein
MLVKQLNSLTNNCFDLQFFAQQFFDQQLPFGRLNNCWSKNSIVIFVCKAKPVLHLELK